MIILSGKITLAVGLFDFAQEGTGKRPRTLEIRQVVLLFRERLHISWADLRWVGISLISVQIFSLLSFRIIKIISGCSKCFFQIPGTKLRGIIFVLKKNYSFFMMNILLKKINKNFPRFCQWFSKGFVNSLPNPVW